MQAEHISPKQFFPCSTPEDYAESGKRAARRLLEGLARFAPDKHISVCDYGSGDGRVAQYVAPSIEEFTCVELTPVLLAATRRTLEGLHYENIRYRLAQGFPGTERFDFIYAMQVLQHNTYAAQIDIIKSIREGLSDAGFACIHLPNKDRTDKPEKRDSSTCMWFSFDMVGEVASYFSRYILEASSMTDYYLWVWKDMTWKA